MIFLSGFTFGQFSEVHFIDTTANCMGITRLATGDLNQDGFDDVVAGHGFNNGRITYYLNDGNLGFGPQQVVFDPALFTSDIALGDMDQDGWLDVVACGGSAFSKLAWYPNQSGVFGNELIIDSLLPFHHLVVQDFDSDGLIDICVAADVSVILYTNEGNGLFRKIVIAQETEYYHIASADMNGDGFQDIVVGNVAVEVFVNDGNGHFDEHYQTTEGGLGIVVHPMDLDGDGDQDVISYDGFNQLHSYMNNGNGSLTYGQLLMNTGAHIQSMESADFDQDGFLDLYTAISSNISKACWYSNASDGTLEPPTTIYQDESIFLNEVAMTDLDNDGDQDIIWSAHNHKVAFHVNESIINQITEPSAMEIKLEPNPASTQLTLETPFSGVVTLTSLNQPALSHRYTLQKGRNHADDLIKHLPDGIYILQFKNELQEYVGSKKLILKK